MKEYNEDRGKKEKKADLPPQTLSVDQNINIEDLKEKFPHLYSELQDNSMAIKIDEVKEDLILSTLKEEDKSPIDPLNNYDPNVFDFLGRAKTIEEGQEIINFLKNRGEISEHIATELIEKLQKEGIRSFGPKRSTGYYFKKAEEIKNRAVIKKRYPSSNED